MPADTDHTTARYARVQALNPATDQYEDALINSDGRILVNVTAGGGGGGGDSNVFVTNFPTRATSTAILVEVYSQVISVDITSSIALNITQASPLTVDVTNVVTVNLTNAVNITQASPLFVNATQSSPLVVNVTNTVVTDDQTIHSRGEVFSAGVPLMGEMDDALTALASESQVHPIRITEHRSLHVALRDSATSVGTTANPLHVDVTNTVTVNVTNAINITQASPLSVNVTGTVPVDVTNIITARISNTTPITVNVTAGVVNITNANPIRVNVTAGRVNVSQSVPFQVQVVNSATNAAFIRGDIGHDAVDSTSSFPIKIGGRGITIGADTALQDAPTQVAANDRVRAVYDRHGFQHIRNWNYMSDHISMTTISITYTDTATAVNSDDIVGEGYRKFTMMCNLVSVGTPTRIRFKLQGKNAAGNYFDVLDGPWGFFAFEDTFVSTEKSLALRGEIPSAEFRIRVEVTDVTATNNFAISSAQMQLIT